MVTSTPSSTASLNVRNGSKADAPLTKRLPLYESEYPPIGREVLGFDVFVFDQHREPFVEPGEQGRDRHRIEFGPRAEHFGRFAELCDARRVNPSVSASSARDADLSVSPGLTRGRPAYQSVMQGKVDPGSSPQ